MPVCLKCGNQDINYFGYDKFNKPYCRLCLSFNKESATLKNKDSNKQFKLTLDYQLSDKQEKASNQILESFKNKKDCLIYAVCGAGKTELVYKTIEYALNNKLQVGFCIPRKDVVIELAPRLKSAFKNASITSVYGGNSDSLTGDIILLTTHQLYRYNHFFDLLIIDETDAFPFRGNQTLNSFFKKSIKGNYIMISATPLEENIQEIKNKNGTYITLMERYHHHPLIVPKIKVFPFGAFLYLVYKTKLFQRKNLPFLIFSPTIDSVEELFKKLNIFIKYGNYVHSKRENREQIINDFKCNKYQYLVTSSILERGITIKNLQVIIFNADNDVYESNTLIQISGRVGRKIDAWDGEVIYICNKTNCNIIESIKKIKEANINGSPM